MVRKLARYGLVFLAVLAADVLHGNPAPAASNGLPDAIQGSWTIISWDLQLPLGTVVASEALTTNGGSATIKGGTLHLSLSNLLTAERDALLQYQHGTAVSIDSSGMTCDALSIEWGALYRHGIPYPHAVASRWFTPDGDIHGTDYVVGAVGDAVHTRHVLSLQFNENGQEFGVAMAR
jgi:hypothetical protein